MTAQHKTSTHPHQLIGDTMDDLSNYNRRAWQDHQRQIHEAEQRATRRTLWLVAASLLLVGILLLAAWPTDAGAAELDQADNGLEVEAGIDWDHIARQVDWLLEFIGADDPIELTLGEYGMRHCESTHNYQAVSPSGTYRGAWQFDQPTWDSVAALTDYLHWKGHDPASAPRKVQDSYMRALVSTRDSQPWPICGRHLSRADVAAILDAVRDGDLDYLSVD